MSDRDAFFQAILAAPDDDAPRLVYADWLDEQGDADRAEFIRVQIELARRPFYDPRCADLERRADELLVRHRPAWRVPDLPAGAQAFRRGFVEELTLSGAQFVQRAAGAFDRTPFRWVRFTGAQPYGPFWWDLVGRLEGVEFPGPPWVQTEEWVGAELSRLRRLKATSLPGVAAFLRAFACPRLEALDLSGSPTPDGAVADFFHATDPTRLLALALDAEPEQGLFVRPYAHRLRAGGARELAGAGLTGLRQLHLRGQLIGDAGLFHLARSPDFAHLEELYLDRNEIGLIGPTGIDDLCSSSTLTRLRVLSLAGNPLGLAAVRELAAWPGLRQLRWLDLTDCGLSAPAGRMLAESPYLHGGLALRLGGNGFDPAELFPAHAP